jgi:serine/threonine-protein kinase OSR1/STK39
VCDAVDSITVHKFYAYTTLTVAACTFVLPREYPTMAEGYELLEECGRGVSATVWRALVKGTNEEVAIKQLDLEHMNCSLDEITRESQTMRSFNHPNLLPLYSSFVHEQHVWMVMPYVAGGSVLNIMKYAFNEGLEEPIIATIMRDVLKALEYLHKNGIIHRDIKAANVLLDTNGRVYLADFGVSTSMERGGSWGNLRMARSTFVGTPCWMAPEVMQGDEKYDAKADIWSFGITLLELAHGHAPFARLPPMKVLMMALQNPPPTLEQSDSKKHFSKAMRDIVAKCLVKNPHERPTASQLLEHKFFKTAHDANYLKRHLLDNLPSIPQRLAKLRAEQAAGKAKQSAQDKEILASQQEYRRGVSAWNFDIAALKAAASTAGSTEDGERMPAITESSEYEGMTSRQLSEMSLGDNATSPQRVEGNAAAVAEATPSKGNGKAAIKEHGRFRVYEGGDEPPPFSPPHNAEGVVGHDESRGGRSPLPGGQSEELDGDEKAKRKGRFRYIEEEGPEGKVRSLQSTSLSASGDAGRHLAVGGDGYPSLPGVTSILPSLKRLLERTMQQEELLKEAVAAVGDVEKGKLGAFNAFLAQQTQAQSSRLDDMERLRTEVAELREENAKLREKVRILQGNN